MRNWNNSSQVNSLAPVSGLQPTYEELKRQFDLYCGKTHKSLQPTYEELKPLQTMENRHMTDSLQPTYEELKQFNYPLENANTHVSSLPMRNWNP